MLYLKENSKEQISKSILIIISGLLYYHISSIHYCVQEYRIPTNNRLLLPVISSLVSHTSEDTFTTKRL